VILKHVAPGLGWRWRAIPQGAHDLCCHTPRLRHPPCREPSPLQALAV